MGIKKFCFKKFKSKYGRTRKVKGAPVSQSPGHAQPEPVPSDEYVRSLQHFQENEDFDVEDDDGGRRDQARTRPVRPTVAELLTQNRRKGGRSPIRPPRKNSIAPEGYMTIMEVADTFGVAYQTACAYQRNGYFGEVLKVSNRVFINRRAVEKREREWEAYLKEKARQYAREDEDDEW